MNRYERPSPKRRRKNRKEFLQCGGAPIGFVWGSSGWFTTLFAKTLSKALNELVSIHPFMLATVSIPFEVKSKEM